MSFLPGEKHDKTPVCLGIKEKNLYLSCVMKGEKPTLQLEVSDCQWLKSPPCSSEAPLTTTNFLDNDLSRQKT